jgi:hypothetical protein
LQAQSPEFKPQSHWEKKKKAGVGETTPPQQQQKKPQVRYTSNGFIIKPLSILENFLQNTILDPRNVIAESVTSISWEAGNVSLSLPHFSVLYPAIPK